MSIQNQISYFQDDIIQIKNFFPDDVFQHILQLEHLELSRTTKNYAGKNSSLPQEVIDMIFSRFASFGFSYSSLEHSRIRVATHDDINDFTSLVHADHNCKRVLVIYLTNTLFKDPKQAGTLFWEHNHTKKRMFNKTNSRDVFVHSLVVERDTKDLSKWTEWVSCPFEENTALLFNSAYFHSPPSPVFEQNAIGKRITLDLFLD